MGQQFLVALLRYHHSRSCGVRKTGLTPAKRHLNRFHQQISISVSKRDRQIGLGLNPHSLPRFQTDTTARTLTQRSRQNNSNLLCLPCNKLLQRNPLHLETGLTSEKDQTSLRSRLLEGLRIIVCTGEIESEEPRVHGAKRTD
jgi:hypothetical protein